LEPPVIPANEDERLASLCHLNILDTGSEEGFDRLTRLAQSHFKVPIALVSLVDSHRQWFKSRQGLNATETPRDISFCGHAILGTDIFCVPDTLEDPRFCDNPLVTSPPSIRFYAGAPLSVSNGMKIGTLCIIDTAPRSWSAEDARILRDLADCVEQELGQAAFLDATQVLASQESRLRAVLDTVVDGIVTIDQKGLIETFNPAAERIFGYRADEVVGHNVKCLMPEPYHSEHDGYLKNFHDSGVAKIIGSGREVIGQRKNGSTFPMELAVSEMSIGGTQMFTGIVRDISERKVSEASLRDREERMSAILNNVVDGIVTIDQRGIIETFNPAAERVFGYGADEVVGHNVKCLMPEPYHSEHDGYLKNFQNSGEAKIIGIGREVIGQRKDGSTFPMELAVGDMEVGGVKMFTGIVRDISDRKQAEMMKTEFISTVSHELRTPLTSIKASLGLIRTGGLGDLPQKLKRMLEIAYSNSDRLVRLINDILDIEKIAAGKMDFHIKPLELNGLLKQAIEANRGYGDKHNVGFILSASVADAMVFADHDRLMQVLANLMSNAAKFAPQGDNVDISLSHQGPGYRVSVTDRGDGIPKEFRDKIFGKFAQADSSDTRQKGGTGLGLNITKAIVEQHGGTIGFETETGKGTTFFFDLPAAQKDETVQKTVAHTNSPSQILICEGEPDTAMLLEVMLQQDGYVTNIAKTAVEAEVLLSKKTYAAMTLDLGLPDKDGITLLRELRQNPKTRNLPIIIISADAARGASELNGDAIGVIDWLEKPIDEKRLSEGLRKAVASSSRDKTRILHVEDDPDILQVVSALVADLAVIVPATTLLQAKALLARHTFDLIILDLTLPDGEGEELLSMLKDETRRSTPVIIFSAQDVAPETVTNIHATLVKSKTSNESLLSTIRSSIDAQQQMSKKSDA